MRRRLWIAAVTACALLGFGCGSQNRGSGSGSITAQNSNYGANQQVQPPGFGGSGQAGRGPGQGGMGNPWGTTAVPSRGPGVQSAPPPPNPPALGSQRPVGGGQPSQRMEDLISRVDDLTEKVHEISQKEDESPDKEEIAKRIEDLTDRVEHLKEEVSKAPEKSSPSEEKKSEEKKSSQLETMQSRLGQLHADVLEYAREHDKAGGSEEKSISGTVKHITSDELKVEDDQGKEHSLALPSEAKAEKDGKEIPISSVKEGAKVDVSEVSRGDFDYASRVEVKK